jgi:hypothetical protein
MGRPLAAEAQDPRAHNLVVYGRKRPGETLIRTAVGAKFMVRKIRGLFFSSGDQQEQPNAQVNANRSIWIK